MSEVTGRDFGRLEGKVDQLLEIIADRGTQLDSLGERMTRVENRLHYWAGGGTMLGALLGWFARPH